MKRIIRYTAIVIALSLAASCDLIEDTTSENGLIRFEPQSVETKALVQPETLTGEQFAVRDLLGGETHINNAIKYSGGKWVYDEPANATYPWSNGTHKFFGYSREGGSFDSNVWTISSQTLTTTANQKDLLYSSIYTTTATAWKSAAGHTKDTPVKLTFHHLLSAVRISMLNGSGAAVTVKSISVNLPNTGSATVSFAGTEAAPSVTVGPEAGDFGGFTTQKTLPAGDSLDVLNGNILSSPATPFLIWPQTLAAGDASITITWGDNTTKTVDLPAATWKAGEINDYSLLLYPNEIKLVFEVQPWEKVEIPAMDTSTGSINMSNVTWMNSKVVVSGSEVNTVDIGGYSVYMYYHPTVDGETYTANNGYYPAQGYFTVNYPKTGVFKIGLIPAYGQTEVDESKYEIYLYDIPNATWVVHKTASQTVETTNGVTITNNTVYFQVRAASGQTGAQHKAQIDIWFQPTGSSEWISAYSEIRANYALIIPAR